MMHKTIKIGDDIFTREEYMQMVLSMGDHLFLKNVPIQTRNYIIASQLVNDGVLNKVKFDELEKTHFPDIEKLRERAKVRHVRRDFFFPRHQQIRDNKEFETEMWG